VIARTEPPLDNARGGSIPHHDTYTSSVILRYLRTPRTLVRFGAKEVEN
jgi:hypothetical protein